MTSPIRVCLFLLFGLLACFSASTTSAQHGDIMIFSSPEAIGCYFVDVAPTFQPVYVFHMYSPGSRGSRFRINVDGLGWTHLGDIPDFYKTSGTSIDGIIVCYESCLSGNFKLLTVNFLSSGLAPACSQVAIDVYPGAGVEALDCDLSVVNPRTCGGSVNNNGTCNCDDLGWTCPEPSRAKKARSGRFAGSDFCALLPVDQSTWGMIKALYH